MKKITIIIILLCVTFTIRISAKETIFELSECERGCGVDGYTMLGERGLVVGGFGLLYYTDDGGKNWSKQYVGTNESIMNIIALDSENIWIYGMQGTIIKYNLVTKAFQDQSLNSKNSIDDIYFFDKNNGFTLTSRGTLFKSTNGGTDWRIFSQIDSGRGFDKILMKNKNIGYVSFHELIQKNHYDPKTQNFDDYKQEFDKISKIYKTTDGGASWTKIVEIKDESVRDMIFINDALCLVGEDGLTIKTDDEKTWTWLDNHTSQAFWQIKAKGNNEFYINAGYKEHYIYKTDSTFSKLEKVYGPESKQLSKIEIINDELFLIEGNKLVKIGL